MTEDPNQVRPEGLTPDPGAEPRTPAAPAGDTAEGPRDGTPMIVGVSPDAPAALSPAVEKFKSCRWRVTPDIGAFCTHRDVLPFAGKKGFVAESWCPECAYYKLRRTPKKRERMDYSY